MEPFRVLMVGPSGVGKTSTLASISEAFQQEGSKLHYHTTIPHELIEKRNSLKRMCDQSDYELDTFFPEGTSYQSDYPFDFFSQTNERDMTVNLIDVCGGWFIPSTQDHPKPNYEEIKELLKSSIASMWCVDCVSMIDGNNNPEYGDYHKIRNEPELIAQLYKNLDSIHPKHRLIFVLVRAEAYHYSQSKDWLFKKFQEYYNPYISEIKERFIDMEFFVVSIETLGNFKFNCWLKFDQDKKWLIQSFRRCGDSFAPQNCETPALLVIDRALKEAASYYEAKKNENLEFYKKRWHTLPVRSLIKFGKLITGLWWRLNSETRAAEIYDLLKNGYPVPPEKYPMEMQYNPDINAHIILKRIQSAAGIMNETINRKKREGCFKAL